MTKIFNTSLNPSEGMNMKSAKPHFFEDMVNDDLEGVAIEMVVRFFIPC